MGHFKKKKKMPHDKVTVSKVAAAVTNNKVTRKWHIDHEPDVTQSG